MLVGKARLKTRRIAVSHAGYSCGIALLLFLFGSKALQNAVAEGDTRTISMHHIHTNEDITITFKRDGKYDDAALEKLNWFLRDWRRNEQTRMDPHLIDLVWEVQREAGSKDPIWVVCGYRSPQTNAMLHRKSSGVARFSQHMLGKAMDFYIPGAPLEELRAFGLRLQRGGVGFYPTSGSPFVHMDTGGIRMWPRMTHDELARVFPDGRTVHIPSDGRPLPGYALALADIRKRGDEPSANSIEAARTAGLDVGGEVASNDSKSSNPFAKLFGFKKDDDDEDADQAASPAAPAAADAAAAQHRPTVLAKIEHAVEKKAAAARDGAVALSKAGAKLMHPARQTATADNAAQPSANDPGGRVAALDANQVIMDRGYWQGLPDAAQRPASETDAATRPHGVQVASAAPDTTGTVGPFAKPRDDRVPPDLALAYAEQPGRDAAATNRSTAMGAAMARAAANLAARLVNRSDTTIAVKGLVEAPPATLRPSSALSTTAIKVGAQFDNPWMRAIIMSPSVQHFLTILALGNRDFTTLATFMVKPANAIQMTFSADPNHGLSYDHFSGSAVVFISTVSYPTHTAALR